jgi:hypothetical protein
MDIEIIERTRKHMFAYLAIYFTLPILIGFIAIDYIEGDLEEQIMNLIAGAVLVAVFVAIRKFQLDKPIYRISLSLLSAVFLYNVIIGSGAGNALYFLFPFPLIFVFFLGKNEGSIFSAVFTVILTVILVNPFNFAFFFYPLGVALRFLASYLLVTFLALGLEAAREKYGILLLDKQKQLELDKIELEEAFANIKTLRGLIPICSHCKKIRDDKGYWQQVELYVREHSDARFSHGICPECYVTHYPGYPLPGQE